MTINHDLIAGYATGLGQSRGPVGIGISKGGDELEAGRVLVLALDSINFGSGWHDVVAKRPGHSGARTMAAALREYESKAGPLSAATLAGLDAQSCAELFGQDPANAQAMELMELFSVALVDLADFLDRYGSAAALINHAGQSAVRLSELLTEMTMFQDVGYYKRAQIAAADLARESLAQFDDLAELTAFADNLVPHVLWVDDVISLEADLAWSIAQGQLLTPGALAECELRAAAVHAVELLASHRSDLTPMEIDEALWQRGGQALYKSRPRPRCRSFYY